MTDILPQHPEFSQTPKRYPDTNPPEYGIEPTNNRKTPIEYSLSGFAYEDIIAGRTSGLGPFPEMDRKPIQLSVISEEQRLAIQKALANLEKNNSQFPILEPETVETAVEQLRLLGESPLAKLVYALDEKMKENPEFRKWGSALCDLAMGAFQLGSNIRKEVNKAIPTLDQNKNH